MLRFADCRRQGSKSSLPRASPGCHAPFPSLGVDESPPEQLPRMKAPPPATPSAVGEIPASFSDGRRRAPLRVQRKEMVEVKIWKEGDEGRRRMRRLPFRVYAFKAGLRTRVTSAFGLPSPSFAVDAMMAAPTTEIRMAAVFGEAKPENDADALPRRPVLFHAHAHAHAHAQDPLRVVATDLRSLAWHCSLDVDDLHDLQDDVGIGGSCSDFLDYLYSSFSSAQVKLLFSAAQGPDTAQLVATKAKGLPRITIPLHPVAASALKDVIADFSLALYASYKNTQEHVSREQERVSQLMESLASEREKSDLMQKQLEALSFLDKRKATKPKVVTDQVPSVSGGPLSSDRVIVPVQQQTSVTSPSKLPPAKATKRVALVSRRARVRGALLQENDDDNS